MVAATQARKAVDLHRYAIRVVGSGEVLNVGLNRHEAEAFVNSFNRTMAGEGVCVERVKIRWEIDEN